MIGTVAGTILFIQDVPDCERRLDFPGGSGEVASSCCDRAGVTTTTYQQSDRCRKKRMIAWRLEGKCLLLSLKYLCEWAITGCPCGWMCGSFSWRCGPGSSGRHKPGSVIGEGKGDNASDCRLQESTADWWLCLSGLLPGTECVPSAVVFILAAQAEGGEESTEDRLAFVSGIEAKWKCNASTTRGKKTYCRVAERYWDTGYWFSGSRSPRPLRNELCGAMDAGWCGELLCCKCTDCAVILFWSATKLDLIFPLSGQTVHPLRRVGKDLKPSD